MFRNTLSRRAMQAIFAAAVVISAIVWLVLRAVGPDNPDVMLRAALQADASATPADLVMALDRILERFPDHAETLWERAVRASDDAERLSWLSHIQQGDPRIVSAARLLEGQIFLTQSRCRDAICAFQQAADAAPDLDAAGLQLIALYSTLRQPERVREELSAIRARRELTLPESALWLTADGRQSAIAENRQRLRDFVAADAGDTLSLRALCLDLAEDGQETEAVTLLQRALDSETGHRQLAGTLGRVLLKSGRVTDAAAVLDPLDLTTDSENEFWLAKAELAFARGQYRLASIASSYLVSVSPFAPSVCHLHVRVLKARGENDDAAVWNKRAELLNLLLAETESLGFRIAERRDPTAVALRVAETLVQLQHFREAREWIGQIESMAGPSEMTAELRAQCPSHSRLDTRPVAPPLSEWQETLTASPADRNGAVMRSNEAQTGSGQIRLADRAAQLGVHVRYENGNTGYQYLVESMGGGVAVIDLDNDSWPDLYFPQGGTLGDGPRRRPVSDRIYRSLPGGRLGDVTEAAGISELAYSQGVAVGDFDQDGFDDVAVANVGRNSLWQNMGDGTCLDVSAGSGLEESEAISSSLAFADFDADGDLDLYAVNYVDGLRVCRDAGGQITLCNPSVHDAAQDQLYENTGQGHFRDVSRSSGLDKLAGKGLGIVVAHLDDDLRPDVFIANDTTANFLLRNRSHHGRLAFEDQGFAAGVAVNAQGQAEAGMGIACADLDHDLRSDFYVTNFYREANSLYLQQSSTIFSDMTAAAGLRQPTLRVLGFGTQAVDLDLDGWQELFVANGHIQNQSDQDIPWKMAPQLFRTTDGTHWLDVSRDSGEFMSERALGRGVARADIDGDLQPDLIAVFQDREAALLMNETERCGNAISLRLVGDTSNRNGLNARLTWCVGGQQLMAEVTSGDGYYCSNERRVLVSLGSSDRADQLAVQWPGGTTDVFSDVAANRSYLVREGFPLLVEPR